MSSQTRNSCAKAFDYRQRSKNLKPKKSREGQFDGPLKASMVNLWTRISSQPALNMRGGRRDRKKRSHQSKRTARGTKLLFFHVASWHDSLTWTWPNIVNCYLPAAISRSNYVRDARQRKESYQQLRSNIQSFTYIFSSSRTIKLQKFLPSNVVSSVTLNWFKQSGHAIHKISEGTQPPSQALGKSMATLSILE